MTEPAKIFAKLKEIKYTTKILSELDVCSALSTKKSFILKTGSGDYAFSQWITPKRTRSYPLSHVYDTLCKNNRVTVIPFCKDEGLDGDRDFLQWDNVSLMSLLNVYVIIGYYASAQKNMRPKQGRKNKITKQIFDYEYVEKKLKELQSYQSSPLHWNLKQMDELSNVAELTLQAYRKIAKETGVKLHPERAMHERIRTLKNSVLTFRESSRQGAQGAQSREVATDQPKERTVAEKAKLTLKNLLGGEYYWTADEAVVLDRRVFLIEKKHSGRTVFPSAHDVKDACVKMALFSNISGLKYDGVAMPYYAAVGMTSDAVCGVLHNKMDNAELEKFFRANSIRQDEKKFMLSAIDEANTNGFGLFLVNSREAEKEQSDILRKLTI